MRVSSTDLILLLSTLSVINGQQVDTTGNDCSVQQTCTTCIKIPNCRWCDIVVSENSTNQPLRCVDRRYGSDSKSSWCYKGRIIDPRSTKSLPTNIILSSVSVKNRVKLNLRIGEEHRLKIAFEQKVDYPVDMYFIVDLSVSMEAFRNSLSELGIRLADEMKKLTTNFRLGFGSFVDKNVPPMVLPADYGSRYQHYSFHNAMPLTNNYELFKNIVISSPLTGNYDVPEGGFDGVMQAMVCQKEIGWRSDARHLLVYASDAPPHIAGDGRLAGLPEPNDEKCHLNYTGYYTHAELQDYPSLGQINRQAEKNNINIIFAVPKQIKTLHEEIKNVIQGSSTGVFGSRSDGVIELIRAEYKKLVRSITMTSNSTTDFLDVKFFSKCLDKTGALLQRNNCDGLRVKSKVEFEVVIKATDCPNQKKDWRQTIEIKPQGINEKVMVDIELICECDCMKTPEQREIAPLAPECHNQGFLECGVCSCNHGSFGKWCQCNNDRGLESTDALLAFCRKDNTTNELCSGRGSCACGVCNCGTGSNPGENYYGKYCQCDDIHCSYSRDRKLCGGNGRCECGECKCNPGWGGTACDCRDDQSLCLPPGDNAQICSGAGKCNCGICECDKDKKRNGPFCEDCPSCPSQRCDEFKDCIECRVHKSGKIYEQHGNCDPCEIRDEDVQLVDDIDRDQAQLEPGTHVCRVPGDGGSTFVFTYVYEKGNRGHVPKIIAKKQKDYPIISGFLAVSIGVMLLTLVLGLLILLIWKLVTSLHDKQEYEKFMKEKSSSKWEQGQNPLYIDAVTTFSNPTFSSVNSDDDL